MKKILLTLTIFLGCIIAEAQSIADYGTEIKIDLPALKNQISSAEEVVIELPMPSGGTESIQLRSSRLTVNQPADILTYSGVSGSSRSAVKITITPSGLTAAIHFNNGYYFIEPVDAKVGRYRMYNMNEAPGGQCGVDDNFIKNEVRRQGRITSVAPFPVGSQLRKLRMAVAGTGEMTVALGGQTQARDKIIAIINASNLIYEVEAALKFELISKTTNLNLVFTNAGTDPFTVDPNFASAGNSQTGFNAMNGNGTLLYNEYDIGHTFNVLGGAGFSASGQAGPTPCTNGSKANAWTEFTANSPLGLIVGIFVHEVGHQFQAWHTYNAIGGSPGNLTFCTGGWDSATAIEPGSGSTLMGYSGNCSSPTNYVLTGNNSVNYFHTKSAEQIFNALNNQSTCFTTTATGNTPPTSNAGTDVTIPKGTPFMLTGFGSDPNGAQILSYTWEQYDVASANDKGAFGSGVNGAGGYTAVNSTASAPLFRSKMSSTPSRIFPDITYITNNANNPPDNAGEDLPQVGRTMKFRFTVRDNAANGGGIDSDEMSVTVNGAAGPLEVSAFNTATTFAAGSSQNIIWNVNGSNAISGNVKISLSTDGGDSFPYVLAASTLNDGSETLTIPANVVATSNGRIKISSLHHPTAEFFDLNNGAITITSTCLAASNAICPITAISANQGDASLNLTLAGSYVANTANNTVTANFTGQQVQRVLLLGNGAGGCTTTNTGTENSVIIPFQVSLDGSYTFPVNGVDGAVIQNNQTVNCANFVASNFVNGTYSSEFTANLTACTTYYFVVYNYQNIASATITIGGPGNVSVVLTPPAGFSYTYAALNKATSQIAAVSATSNFTILGAGNYDVVGLAYENAFNPNTLVNQTTSQAYGTGSCLLFSGNSKSMTITGGSPCPPSLTLVSPANNIASGTVKQEVSGTITATNKVTGGNVKYDAGQNIQLNPGFTVNNGVVFSAYIDGCGGQ